MNTMLVRADLKLHTQIE